MKPEYEPFFKQIDTNLRFRIHDCMDDHNHPTARALEQDMRDLASDFKTNKNPRDLEDSIKVIQARLREAHSHPGAYMSVEDADQFYHIFEDMRMSLRKLSNY